MHVWLLLLFETDARQFFLCFLVLGLLFFLWSIVGSAKHLRFMSNFYFRLIWLAMDKFGILMKILLCCISTLKYFTMAIWPSILAKHPVGFSTVVCSFKSQFNFRSLSCFAGIVLCTCEEAINPTTVIEGSPTFCDSWDLIVFTNFDSICQCDRVGKKPLWHWSQLWMALTRYLLASLFT
jgi:hypothetical protein